MVPVLPPVAEPPPVIPAISLPPPASAVPSDAVVPAIPLPTTPAPAAPVARAAAAVVIPAGPPAGVAIPPLALPAYSEAKTSDAPKPEPKKLELAPNPAPAVPAAPVVPAVPAVTATPPAGNTDPAVPVVTLTPAAPAVPAIPVAPADPTAPPRTIIREAAKQIPPETVKPVSPGKGATPPADPPVVTGPSTSARPTRYQTTASHETTPAAPGVRVGVPAADAGAAFEGMLLDARAAYARVKDYACHFLRQERVAGRLMPEQAAEMYVRANPHSVALKVIAPAGAAGAEAVYVTGRNAGKVRMKPAGAYGATAWVAVDPTDPRIASEARHSAADVGIGVVIERLGRIVSVERRLRNPLEVLSADYTYAGRAATRFEVVAGRPHALRYAHRVVVYVDKETKLPIRFEAYDQPTPDHPTGELLESHSFVNVKLNVGVGNAVFDK